MTVIKTPAYGMIYDRYSECQIKNAMEAYASLLPSIATSVEVTDDYLLDQLAVAERALHAFSSAFGLKNTEGVELHTVYRNDVRRDSTTLAHTARVFTHLQSLMSHPAFVMLTTISAVKNKTKPPAVIRDVRWSFQSKHGGLVVDKVDVLFAELAALLHQMVSRVRDYPVSEMTLLALNDFEGYMFDGEKCMVNELNFGTASALAQSVLDCARRR